MAKPQGVRSIKLCRQGKIMFFENSNASVRYSTCVTEEKKSIIFQSEEFNWVHTLN
jgi:hypothetical protein